MLSKVTFLTRKRRLVRQLMKLNTLLEFIPKEKPCWFGFHIQQEMLLDELNELMLAYEESKIYEWQDFELN
jgi:hypothetical protein